MSRRAINKACRVFTNNESRNTCLPTACRQSRDRQENHGLDGRSARGGCARVAQPEAVAGPSRPPTSHGFASHYFPVKTLASPPEPVS